MPLARGVGHYYYKIRALPLAALAVDRDLAAVARDEPGTKTKHNSKSKRRKTIELREEVLRVIYPGYNNQYKTTM